MQMPIIAASFAATELFAIFYIGQQMHSNLLNLVDAMYQSKWYRYQRTAKLCILLMMKQSQRPFYLSVFGVITFELETFVKVN